MDTIDLKTQGKISRDDIAKLLSSIGEPGEKQEDKFAAVQELGRSNTQNHGIELTLESYKEY